MDDGVKMSEQYVSMGLPRFLQCGRFSTFLHYPFPNLFIFTRVAGESL